jgi:hypothetical protein
LFASEEESSVGPDDVMIESGRDDMAVNANASGRKKRDVRKDGYARCPWSEEKLRDNSERVENSANSVHNFVCLPISQSPQTYKCNKVTFSIPFVLTMTNIVMTHFCAKSHSGDELCASGWTETLEVLAVQNSILLAVFTHCITQLALFSPLGIIEGEDLIRRGWELSAVLHGILLISSQFFKSTSIASPSPKPGC